MITIEKVDESHAGLLANIAALTFIESHGSSAPREDVNGFIAEKYNQPALTVELLNTNNNYYFIYYNKEIAGFSNIVFDFPSTNTDEKRVAKLERIYILKSFYDRKLGYTLLEFNIKLARENNQVGIWLFVWKENHRAIHFYNRNGFSVIGSFDFKISASHSNPNHQMFLEL